MKVRIPIVLILFATLATVAFGQATNSADIRGTVTDSSGAVILGASITVKDVDKGDQHVFTTDGAGIYDTGPLVPDDRYTITYTKEGFASLQRGPMTLRIGVMGLNVQLSVGQTTQQVIVEESAPLLETTSAEISSTLPSETLQELPQSGAPDWQGFLVLLPGVNGAPQNGNSAGNPGMGGAAANGSLPFSTALLDGASTSSPMSNNVLFAPIFEALAEVKVTDSLFSAQYGIGGMLFNQISKGGSNQFHGTVYDYMRNNDLNAASYAFGKGVVSPLHYNDFGFNVGGPVIRNRVYFFFDYDLSINHGAPASQSFITVPTAAMRAGDFTGLPTIYDPTTQTVVNGVVTRQSFAAEYGNGNKIPASMIDNVAKAIQAIYPLPTPGLGTVSNGVTLNNYAYLLATKTPGGKYFGRFDADVTKTNRVTGSAEWNYQNTPSLTPVCPINCVPQPNFTTNNQISDVWTINSSLVNEARLGFMGEYDVWSPETYQQGWPAKLGLQFAKEDIFPNITITNYYGLASGVHSNYKENLFDVSDVVTLIKGRHVIHAGGEMLIERSDSLAYGNITSAALSFTGGYTTGSNSGSLATTTGASYADFLLGYSKSWSAGQTPEYGGRLKSPALFVQDDLKLFSRLNLNLGLRYFGTTGWSEIHRNERGFDPTIVNPATNAPGAMWYGTTHTNGRTALEASQFDNWLPRVGAAYQLGDKTTIRGGFGMYTFPWNTDTYGSGQGSELGTSGNESDSTNNVQPVVILSSDGNTNYQGAKGASINSLFVGATTDPSRFNGQAVGFTQYHQAVPGLMQWNLGVQRQVGSNMVVGIAYVGSHGSNLAYVTDLNQVPQSLLGATDSTSRPYPEFQSITGVRPIATSNYNSLQAQIERRMSNGLEFNFNYTWSHMLDSQDSSGWGSKQGNQPYQNAYLPSANYGASNFDIRQAFKGQAVYQLPFGVGRKFLNQSGAVDEILGGWLLSATWVGQTGNPFTPTMATNNSYSLSSNAYQFPNVVGDPKANTQGINGWFNVAALASPGAGVFGNEHRNNVYGPGLTQLNASLHKSFSIWEHVTAEFSANATNLPNHPSFAQPDALIGTGHTAKITGVTVSGRAMELVGKIRF
jgi:hypothetical protein